MRTAHKIILTIVALILSVIIIVLLKQALGIIDIRPIGLGAIISIALIEVIRAIWKLKSNKK